MTVKNKNNILYLDDEQVNLDVFKSCFSESYDVYTTSNYNDALDLIENEEIEVVLSDQRMPEITGIEFIQKVKAVNSHIVCILLTAYPNNDVLMSSINEARIFRFMTKPWKEFEMEQTLMNAIELYNSRVEKRKLIHDLQISRAKAMESDRLKSAFLHNLSHEIRTPLNGILGFSSMLHENTLNSDKLKKYREVIDHSCDQLLEVIDDIVNMSQIQAGEVINTLNRFDLIRFLNGVCCHFSPSAFNKNITIDVQSPVSSNTFDVEADKTKLYEIFNQLMKNAIKFTHQGGIQIGFSIDKTITFFVKDSGIGISKAKQEQIFQTFRQESEQVMTREYGGNGLGLSIAKGLVEMVDGEIWVESEKGKGATFYFKFPIKTYTNTDSIKTTA